MIHRMTRRLEDQALKIGRNQRRLAARAGDRLGPQCHCRPLLHSFSLSLCLYVTDLRVPVPGRSIESRSQACTVAGLAFKGRRRILTPPHLHIMGGPPRRKCSDVHRSPVWGNSEPSSGEAIPMGDPCCLGQSLERKLGVGFSQEYIPHGRSRSEE